MWAPAWERARAIAAPMPVHLFICLLSVDCGSAGGWRCAVNYGLRTSGCARDEGDLIREGEQVEDWQQRGQLSGRHNWSVVGGRWSVSVVGCWLIVDDVGLGL